MKRKLPFFLALILALFLCTALTRAENLTPWQSLQERLNAGGHIKLTQNVTAAAGESGLIVPSSVTVTLDLNGFTIDRGLADSSPQSKGYVIKNEGNLTIRDSSAAQTGAITGGNNSDWYQGSGISNINGDSILTLEGGAITGNHAESDGGAVFCDHGYSDRFTCSGGLSAEIRPETAEAVFTYAGAKLAAPRIRHLRPGTSDKNRRYPGTFS